MLWFPATGRKKTMHAATKDFDLSPIARAYTEHHDALILCVGCTKRKFMFGNPDTRKSDEGLESSVPLSALVYKTCVGRNLQCANGSVRYTQSCECRKQSALPMESMILGKPLTMHVSWILRSLTSAKYVKWAARERLNVMVIN